MKISERTLRITAASVLALIMVGATYLLSGPSFLMSNSANAESTEELLKAYATKDTDGDGLPDWEEALYGTDPNKAISNPYGIPDGEAAREGKLTPNALATQLPSADQGTTTLTSSDLNGIPAPAAGSLTEQFSQQFFQQYVQASNGQPMDQATQQQLVTSLLGQFTQQAAATFASNYSAIHVHTSAYATTQTYAAGIENAITNNDVHVTKNQLSLMADILEQDDASAKKELLAVSNSYQAMADDMKLVPVPPALSQSHVALIQSLETMAHATKMVVNYKDDPLGTMGALSAYSTATDQYAQALTQVATVILSGGEPADGAPGSYIVLLARLSSS